MIISKRDFGKFFKDSYPLVYSLSFILVPETLQAEQICLDSLELLALKERKLMMRLAHTKSQNTQPLWDQLKKNHLKYVWILGIKRFTQLKGNTETWHEKPDEFFFTQNVLERGILFLKTRLRLSLSDIEFITDCDRYKILSYLCKSRDDLLWESHKRNLSLPQVIGN
ncbi:MAG: hypothetical protein OXB88_07465 [Bacteriovoracales bacterium]|nr:hypothetical protein [Bacteriovoracales bacterium]